MYDIEHDKERHAGQKQVLFVFVVQHGSDLRSLPVETLFWTYGG